MTIKELFKKVELANNEISFIFGDEYAIEYQQQGDIDSKVFTSYEEFKQWVKEEINKPWADILLGDTNLRRICSTVYWLETTVDLLYTTERFDVDFTITKIV